VVFWNINSKAASAGASGQASGSKNTKNETNGGSSAVTPTTNNERGQNNSGVASGSGVKAQAAAAAQAKDDYWSQQNWFSRERGTNGTSTLDNSAKASGEAASNSSGTWYPPAPTATFKTP